LNSRTRLVLGLLLATGSGLAVADHFRCVSLQYPPLVYQNNEGQIEGLAFELVSTVFKQMGHSISVEVLPWARSLALMKTGERDCIFTIFRNPERESFLDFNQQSIIPQVVYLYAKKGSAVSYDGNPGSLTPYRIGTVSKINYGPKFEELRNKMMLEEVPTLEQNLKKLALGRIDLVPSNFYTASYTLGQDEIKPLAAQLTKLALPLDTVPSYIGFAKERNLQVVAAQFDVHFKKVMHSGMYRKLLKKYDIQMTPELRDYLRNY
jgi:polar amino acid transport system substrate-binding protein